MEQGISNIASLLNETHSFVRGAPRETEFGEVERRLIRIMMAVVRAALSEFAGVQQTGIAGGEILDAQGQRWPYVRDRMVHIGRFGVYESNVVTVAGESSKELL